MGLRVRLSGEWWCTLYMEVHGEGGFLMSPLVCMRWVYGRILRGVRGSFVVILDLRCEMALSLDSSTIFGVGIKPLRKPFQFYLVFACLNDASVAILMEFSGGAISGT
jgi:hypothetical protein